MCGGGWICEWVCPHGHLTRTPGPVLIQYVLNLNTYIYKEAILQEDPILRFWEGVSSEGHRSMLHHPQFFKHHFLTFVKHDPDSNIWNNHLQEIRLLQVKVGCDRAGYGA